jgi:uncharacterized protein
MTFAQLLLSAIVSILLVTIAKRRHFFVLPEEKERDLPSFFVLLGVFIIYLLGGTLIPWVFFQGRPAGLEAVSWASFTTSVVIVIALLSYARCIPAVVWKDLWGTGTKRDVMMALLTWIIAFPCVAFVGQLLTGLVYLFFHTFELPDQIAIRLMRLSFQYPFYFLINALSVVIFAPFIEELIFRGFFQSYLRRFCSRMGAIVGTSLLFAFFHFSREQGLGNVPLLGSLFVFSIFLGFIYEKQRSLAASISLHATFNLLSIAGLYFLKE